MPIPSSPRSLTRTSVSPPAFLVRWLLAGLIAFISFRGDAPAVAATFGPGSLVIPMDVGNVADDGQDDGMLRAYGLVYALLRSDVPVSWAIDPVKTANGDDFTIASGIVTDLRTAGAVTLPRTYRGGPFIVAAADATSALPIIQAWQATLGDQTEVHELGTGASVTVDVARQLLRAPRIGVLRDGNEQIAFNDLNAAGIPDSSGDAWGSASPDLLTEAQVAGLTTLSTTDGVLFHQPSGEPRYCHLLAMHYIVTADTPNVIAEVRSWLDDGPLTHAFMQCLATETFENDANGRFLTTGGILDDGGVVTSPVNHVPSNPLSQIDGPFAVDSGAVDSIGLAGGSAFKVGVQTLFNENATPLTQRITMVTGRMDGSSSNNGRVTYFGGHDYSIALPVSTNPQTNGVRLLLNSIFESDCATSADPDPQDDVVLTKSAPAFISGNQIDYTIEYFNPGPRPIESLTLTDIVPAGTTYVVASGVPAPASTAGGVLRWNLPSLAASATGTVTFSVNVPSDGTYQNDATLDYSHLTVRSVVSNTVTTEKCPLATYYADDDDDGFGDPFATTLACAIPPASDPPTGYVQNDDDCDDTDDSRHPAATEVIADGVDQDCDELELCYLDADNDGYLIDAGSTVTSSDMTCDGPGEEPTNVLTGDCDDSNANRFPSNVEIIDDGVDNDCVLGDRCYLDADDDDHRHPSAVIDSIDLDCEDGGEAVASDPADDCDDNDPDRFPGNPEVFADGIDQNCDGGEICYLDADGDGYLVNAGSTVASADLDCTGSGEAPTNTQIGDCDDDDANRFPGNTETVDDGIDQNCDGGDLCYADGDDDGYRAFGLSTVASADLICGNDPGEASISDGVGDCNDSDAAVYPGAVELCGDGIDNDCDTVADCLESSCDADPFCVTPCTAGPFVCKAPGRAALTIRNQGDDRRDTLKFTWTLGDPTTAAELGDPTVDTQYTLCVWDHVAGTPDLVMSMKAPPAGNCAGNPCWKSLSGGDAFRYRDLGRLPDGVQQLTIRSGPLGKPRVVVRAKGTAMPDPAMPFTQAPQITVQVVNSLGNCWGVDFVSPPLANSGSRLTTKETP